MMIARFISGLPHGAYFGVGSIIASKLAKEGKSTEAISIMVAGMTIANLLGVPLGTSLSSLLSWRWVFGIVGIGGLAVLFYIWRWVPQVEKLPNTGFKGQFRFLKSGAPWLIIAGTMFGNGGIFCWYSYIHPLLTDVAGFPEAISLRDWLLHSLRDVQHCFFFLFSFGHHTLYSWCCLCAFVPCLYSPYQVHNSFLSYVTHKEENYWEQPVYKWHSI